MSGVGIDPRLTVWAREQSQALGQIDTDRRVRIIERTIGVAAKTVRDDLQGQIDTTVSQVSALAAVAILSNGVGGVNLTFGSGSVTWGGGTATATSGYYNHNLGRLPAAVLVTPQSQAGTGPFSLQLPEEPSDTVFRVYACTVPVGSSVGYVPPGGTSVTFGWIAIG